MYELNGPKPVIQCFGQENPSESNARMHVRKPFRIDFEALHTDNKSIQKDSLMRASTSGYLGTFFKK